jgi:hypothetical protein
VYFIETKIRRTTMKKTKMKLPDAIGNLSLSLENLQKTANMNDGQLATFLEQMVKDIRKTNQATVAPFAIDYQKEQAAILAEYETERKCKCAEPCNKPAPELPKSDNKSVHACFARAEMRQEDLWKLLIALEEKLSPVLRNSCPCCEEKEVAKSEDWSAVAGRLSDMGRRMDNACKLVATILDRLDV